LIVTTDAAADLPGGVESHDWRQASLSELCNHIVDVHHAALRRELPQIQELLDSVMGRSASINGPAVGVIEHDHDEVADKLAQLRELTADYDTAQALCRTHHRLLEALRSLELELHHHVHEENNILLPRLRSLLRTPHEHAALEAPRPHSRPASRPDRSREELPRCCQGWLAEQTHRTISSRAH
jgi:iron-sulfur cluster repair protein YtfE (RIC family)